MTEIAKRIRGSKTSSAGETFTPENDGTEGSSDEVIQELKEIRKLLEEK